MDYEKKYKEALGWMQSLYDGLHGATKEDAEHYFPELKESEDERIRKELIDYHRSMAAGADDYVHEAWISWLEKQGEQKPAEPLIPGQEPLYDYTNVNIIQKDFAPKTAEEATKEVIQDNRTCVEQKPIETCKFKVGDVVKYNGTEYKITAIESNGYRVYTLTYDEDAASLIGFNAPITLVERDSIDEHEFLKMASNSYSLSFINYLDAHLYEGKMCVSNGECEDIENAFRICDWGKIGRYYNKFTQKPAWSEEDEKMLKMVIKSCEQCGNEYAYYWLKSLKDRYTWKPSDEQMDALENAIRYGEEELIGILSLLYNDLKKLK